MRRLVAVFTLMAFSSTCYAPFSVRPVTRDWSIVVNGYRYGIQEVRPLNPESVTNYPDFKPPWAIVHRGLISEDGYYTRVYWGKRPYDHFGARILPASEYVVAAILVALLAFGLVIRFAWKIRVHEPTKPVEPTGTGRLLLDLLPNHVIHLLG